MIISEDYFGSLISGKMLLKDGVKAMESYFRWLIFGPIKNVGPANQITCYSINAEVLVIRN